MEQEIMKPWKIDVNVLIIFFVRDDVLQQTFESVRQARPRRLLLWQDGAREGRINDRIGIERCRKIVENIDWDCEVYKNYQTHNWGCDPSTFYSHKWAFSIVDKCIVLEDDCCPTQSFYHYCKELLDKYENDSRINRICGMNNLGETPNCPESYFFTRSGSVWGWATWRRVAESWEEDYACLNDEYRLNLLKMDKNYPEIKVDLPRYVKHKNDGKPYWESIQSLRKLLYSSLDIVPKKNMIRSLGVNAESTHSVGNIKLVPRKIRKAFYQQGVYETNFPMIHPKYVVENYEYNKALRAMATRSLSIRIDSFFRHLIFGDTIGTLKKLFATK